jgi:hypothetical protein
MSNVSRNNNIYRRYYSLHRRISSLTWLRRLVNLQPSCDLTEAQWSSIEFQLSSLKNRLIARLSIGARKYLPELSNIVAARKMNTLIGALELEASKAFTFVDTLSDLFTQRNSKLGEILPGCERIASDALRRNHPFLKILEAPVVCFNRGYGASYLREGVPLPYGIRNPISIMQLPYARLVSLSTLTSIAHEAGHHGQHQLGLESTFHTIIRKSLISAGASRPVVDLLSQAHTEIFADVWGMCLCGLAYLSVSRDLLSVPPSLALAINFEDPHPTPLVRLSLLFNLSRQMWRSGVWDRWEEEVLSTYPLDELQKGKRDIIEEQMRFAPDLSRVILGTSLKELGGKPITSLFNIDVISPQSLNKHIHYDGTIDLSGLSACQQLSLFRYLFDRGNVREEVIDRMVARWLLSIGQNKELASIRLLK